MPIVEVRGLTKIYGTGDTAVTALDQVDLSVEPGEFVAVMGPSGCGKSTLLNLIGGLDTPTSGQVVIDGTDIATMSDKHVTELRRRRLGFIFQFFNLITVLNATENVALPLMLDGKSLGDSQHQAEEWLTRVGLANRMHSRPDQLSGGQQQRVAVARALVTEPVLMLADEPTGNLDLHSSEDVSDLLKQASEEWNRAIVMVTHDLRVASHARRVVLMADGRIVDDIKLDGQDAAETVRAAMAKSGLL